MSKKSTSFTTQFALLRKQSGLSYRRMELVTGIKYSALAAMENGNRPIGEQSARRIVTAFELSDDVRERFVLTALNTSKERVLESVKDFPAEVVNALGLLLLANGVKAKQITDCDLDSFTSDELQNSLRLSLKDGRTARLHISLLLEA